MGDEKRNRWIAENKESYDKQRKDWATKNADRLRIIERRKVYRRYGITESDYNAMLEKQGGVCAICKERADGNRTWTKKLAIDHDHSTGKVRGLLCFRCNTRLGHIESGWIDAAKSYLGI